MAAMAAMSSICVNAGRNEFNFNDELKIAIKSYKIADAMIYERMEK